MTTKTKTRSVDQPYRWIDGHCYPSGSSDGWDVYVEGYKRESETIVYPVLPQRMNGHNVWKPCTHTARGASRGELGSSITVNAYGARTEIYRWSQQLRFRYGVPKGGFPRAQLAELLRDQLDLNCHETVLLYSGILQAVPLVGGAFKFVSVMNRAARKFSKSFKKKPFTTVVKAAISGDFINRFVIKPTIDDARKFINAHNYVVNIMNSAYERDSAPFAIQARVRTVHNQTSYSGHTSSVAGMRFNYDATEQSVTDSKAFLLLSADYNTNAIDPIKLWATRLGILNPLDSIWDLIPFSFVVDYFAKAGDFIQSLGEKVTSQDGLTGKISNIYGLWGSLKNSVSVHARGSSLSTRERIESISYGEQTLESYDYTRFQIGEPYSFMQEFEESGFLTIPSLTQARTLAQLLIQAKL